MHPDDDLVTLKVGRGSQMENFEVPSVLLTKASRYFADKIPGRNVFFFPNDTMALFMNSTSFLYHGNLFGPGIPQYVLKHLKYEDMVDLYILANGLKVPSLRNAALDAIFARVSLESEDLPSYMVREIYSRTAPNSSLRNLVIDIMINMGDKEEVHQWGKRWPKKFLAGCLVVGSEDEVVPFERTGVSGWLEVYRNEMCEMYHRHDEGEEDDMVRVKEEVDEDVEVDETESERKAQVYIYPPNRIKHRSARY